MVLASYGIEHTEAELYSCCVTDIDGTLPSAAARCAQSLGFDASATRLSGLDELQAQLIKVSLHPIVFVNLSPLLGLNVIHDVIVEAIDFASANVHVIDWG
jgi:hypothetical protein